MYLRAAGDAVVALIVNACAGDRLEASLRDAWRRAMPIRAPLAARSCLPVLLALAGCGLNRQLARQADAIVAAARPDTLTCTRADHCAIDSPYRQLVAAARAADTPAAPVHYVNVLERGEDSLLLRIHLIRAASTSIDIQTFIWAEDDAGWLMLDELIAAARRGVHVRVLADQLFSLDDVEWLARIARAHANLDFRLYNPTFDKAVTQPLEFAAGVLCCFSKFNQRMHNKLLLVDGEIGIAGGRNYEDRYFDWDDEFDYRDRDVLVLGPQTGREMQASFDQFWAHPRARAADPAQRRQPAHRRRRRSPASRAAAAAGRTSTGRASSRCARAQPIRPASARTSSTRRCASRASTISPTRPDKAAAAGRPGRAAS